MKKKFPYSRQSLDNNDIKAVIKILKADIITRGEAINNFENKICKFYLIILRIKFVNLLILNIQ